MTLYINACARPDSRTDRLARALLATLGDYEELRLYDLPLLPLNTERLARRDALLARAPMTTIFSAAPVSSRRRTKSCWPRPCGTCAFRRS